MKITFTLFLLFLLCSFSLYAQKTYSIKGSVSDTASASRLNHTAITILNQKDSTLVKFTRSEPDGTFAITGLRKGKYILMMTYPDYADFIERFQLDSSKTEVNFGAINMRLKSRVLAEVIIKSAKDAIKIKGDTTEYNASSFVIQPNSKVEDLLKQLPGIQVDKDGKITAQGQTVNKVLVDGEEFFGDDPTLVTKNIRGDMVDKVQVYDKKSDQATFTGIDDGVKNKTINIKLKEDKKNGYFGKLDAGYGTDKYYSTQGLFNVFKGKQKLAFYGTVANTGKIGLGWDDNNKLGTSSFQLSDDGGFYFSNSRDEFESFDGNYNGRGIPIARTGGVHYDNKFDADKQTVNGNYKIGYLQVDGFNGTITQNNLSSGVQNITTNQSYSNSAFRQKADVAYTLKIDSLTNLKITLDGTLKHAETHNTFFDGSTYRNFDTLLNKSNRTLNNNTDARLVNASVFYNKKFKKAGRSFSWNVAEAYNDNTSDGFLNSAINFYNVKTVAVDSTRLINQYKTTDAIGSNLTSNITYSEPFTKKLALIVNYGTGLNTSTSDRKSFDQSAATGQYTLPNSALSNNYKFDQFSNQLGASFNYKTAKATLNFGSKATEVQFTQTNEYTGSKYKRNFLNWNPQATYQYKFSNQKSLYLNYSGNTTQPTIDQIQPVLVNTDPLNITLGNPDLTPSFRHNFGLNFNNYKVLSGQSYYVGANFSLVTNPIVSNITTSSTGKTTSIYSNLGGKEPINFNLYSNFNQKIKKIDLNVSLNVNANGNTSYNYANNVLGMAKSFTYNARLGLSKYKEKKYNAYISAGPSYTISSSSLQPNINNNGAGATGYGDFGIYLPFKFEINSDAQYQYTAATQSFNQDFSKLTWNGSLSKKFLKEDNLKLSVAVNDILNQNVGFNRSAFGSTISQNSYTSIRRYFMFSITYDFSKMGGAPEKK